MFLVLCRCFGSIAILIFRLCVHHFVFMNIHLMSMAFTVRLKYQHKTEDMDICQNNKNKRFIVLIKV